jgi:hypothetical protein
LPPLLLLSLFPLAAAASPPPVVVVVGGFSRNSLHGYRVNHGGAVSQCWFLRKCTPSSLLPPSLSCIKKWNQGEEHEHQTLISGRDSSPFAELHVSIGIWKLFKQVRIYVLYLKLPSLNSGPQTV